MLRSVYLLRCRTCINLKEIVTYRKFSNALCNAESFHSRALKYLGSSARLQKPLPKTSEIYASEEYFNNLLQRTQKTLTTIYSDFKEVQNKNDQIIRNKVLDRIDTKCFSIVHLLNPHQIFDLLYNFYQVYPNQMQTTYFYEKAISYLVTAVESGLLNNEDVIQLIFYMGMNRDIVRSYMHDIRPFITDMKHLSLFEKCIVADCFVKSDVKFTPAESKLFEQTLEDQFELLKKDTTSLIILCKALTLVSSGDTLTLRRLSDTIISSKEPWSFKVLVNLLNLYSRALLFEPKVIDSLVKDGIEAMKKDLDCDTHKLELEDINKFLTSLSNLGLTLTLNEKLVLRTTIERRFEEYRQQTNLSHFVNAILCLHILRCWSTKLLIKCFRIQVFEPIRHFKSFHGVQPKLNLLMSQIKLEMKLEVPRLLITPIPFKYTPSMNINRVRDICQKLVDNGIVDSVGIECPIEALPIPGVTLKTVDMTYHIDILDNTTCLKNTYVPHGYMNLKLRLLSRLRYRQILVQKSFLEKPEEMERYVKDKINFGRASTFHQKCMQECIAN